MPSEFCGRLEELKIRDVLSLIGHSRRTGQLVLRCNGRGGTIEFHDGNIVRAENSSGHVDIGTILVEAQAITDAQLKDAAKRQRLRREPVPLGRLLIELGYASGEQVRDAMRRQVDHVLVDLLALADGQFAFEASATSMDTITQNTSDVLIEADVRRVAQG